MKTAVKKALSTRDLKFINNIEYVDNHGSGNYDKVQEIAHDLDNLLGDLGLSSYDVEPYGTDYMISNETATEILKNKLKQSLDSDNEVDPAVVQDLDEVIHSDDDFFWVNGYERLLHVTDDDIDGELDDLLTFLDEHNK